MRGEDRPIVIRTDGAKLALLLALAAEPRGGFMAVRSKPSRTNCARCGVQIPPGRAGRQCECCRGGSEMTFTLGSSGKA